MSVEAVADQREKTQISAPLCNTRKGIRSVIDSHRSYMMQCVHVPPALSHNISLQPNLTTQAVQTQQWTRLILSYARHKHLFILKLDDCEIPAGAQGDWDEILQNDRINRKLLSSHLSLLMASMVSQNLAVYEPPKQTRSVIVYWRLPEEWAEVVHEWATSTGQLNTILTFYELTTSGIDNPTKGLPLILLRKVIAILGKTGRGQIIEGVEGGGVRFFPGTGKS
ncbi:hypothetical protein Clacol_005440 [Clathrus columnatus]|uniref:ESCRT-II complex vps25 subunit n=1 Tax=Clathrus columnatus TaxID=1419009 RepID=A0AAV5ACM1_9AGAM|nr:hypothetical protein Clacol_005440 [Clathrus columnatus]